MAIAGKVAITPKGEWDSALTYEKLDAVSYNNGLYIAKKASSGTIPEDGETWMLAVESLDMNEFNKIIDGTTVVGEATKATQDGNGNNIVDTYQTKTGDTNNNTVAYTSADSTSPTEWTDVAALASGEKHSSILNKISTMFKNIRWLYKMLGTTDISAIGDGTVTGAISGLNNGLIKIGSHITLPKLSHTCTLSSSWEKVTGSDITIPKGSRYLILASASNLDNSNGYNLAINNCDFSCASSVDSNVNWKSAMAIGVIDLINSSADKNINVSIQSAFGVSFEIYLYAVRLY